MVKTKTFPLITVIIWLSLSYICQLLVGFWRIGLFNLNLHKHFKNNSWLFDFVKRRPVWTQNSVFHTNENNIKQLDATIILYYLVYCIFFRFVRLTLSCLLCNSKSCFWKVWQFDQECAWLCGIVTLCLLVQFRAINGLTPFLGPCNFGLFKLQMHVYSRINCGIFTLDRKSWLHNNMIAAIWLHVFCCLCRTFGGGVHAAGLLLQWGWPRLTKRTKETCAQDMELTPTVFSTWFLSCQKNGSRTPSTPAPNTSFEPSLAGVKLASESIVGTSGTCSTGINLAIEILHFHFQQKPHTPQNAQNT